MPGKKLTTGKFDTREDLIYWVCYRYRYTKANMANVARSCGISPTLANSLYDANIEQFIKAAIKEGLEEPITY